MMVRSIFGLFSQSPFTPFMEMADKVEACASQIPVLFDAFFEGNEDRVRQLAEEISHLEHEADVTKTRVRDSLPRSLFMSVDRRDLLDVLSSLDAVADCAEDVAILFTLRSMEPHDDLVPLLKSLIRRVMATVEKCLEIVREMEVLGDAGMSGREASRVRGMIDELGRLEHEADLVQDDLARKLFSIEESIKPASLLMWNKIFNKLGDMANHAEKCGNRLRLFFAQ